MAILNLSGYDAGKLPRFGVHGVEDPMNVAISQRILSARRAGPDKLVEWAKQVAHLAAIECDGEEKPKALIGGVSDCTTAVLPPALKAEGITPLCLLQKSDRSFEVVEV